MAFDWWHEDLFLPILIVFYLAVTGALILWLRPYGTAKDGRRLSRRIIGGGGDLMNAIVRALKATYNFFVGDVILLAGVALAFVLGLLLVQHWPRPIRWWRWSSSAASSAGWR